MFKEMIQMSNATYAKYVTYGPEGIPYFTLVRSSFLTHEDDKDPLHELMESLVILGYLEEPTYYGLSNALKKNTFNFLHLINNDEDKYSHVNMRFIVNILEALYRNSIYSVSNKAILDSLMLSGIFLHANSIAPDSFERKCFAIDLYYLNESRINKAEEIFNSSIERDASET